MILYSIPKTQPPVVESCEVTEHELVLHLDDRTDRIARDRLSTEALIETYGALEAAERIAQSHGERTYEWINWQVAPLFACTLGIPTLATCLSHSSLIGLIWLLFTSGCQWTAHALAYESAYRSEDTTLFNNLDCGLLNLRRIEALEIGEIDKVRLKHRTGQIESLAHAALLARRTDPTVSERIINNLFSTLFDTSYYISDL